MGDDAGSSADDEDDDEDVFHTDTTDAGTDGSYGIPCGDGTVSRTTRHIIPLMRTGTHPAGRGPKQQMDPAGRRLSFLKAAILRRVCRICRI